MKSRDRLSPAGRDRLRLARLRLHGRLARRLAVIGAAVLNTGECSAGGMPPGRGMIGKGG